MRVYKKKHAQAAGENMSHKASATLAVEITQDGMKDVMFLKHVAGEATCMDHLVSRSSRCLRKLRRN